MESNGPLNPANTKAQMRKGLIEFCILLIISEGKTYANDMLRELKAADLIVVEGTLYPLLTRLKNAGLLAYRWEESRSGPPRKYYSITPAGQIFLDQLTLTWKALDHSINTLLKKFK